MILIAVVLGVVFAVLGNLFPASPDDPDGDALGGAIGAAALLLLPGLYFVPFDTRSGRSPGRRVANLRLAALDGRERLGLSAALRRALWRYVGLLPCGLGYLWAIGGGHRAWHDIFSNTVVVPADAVIVVEEQVAPEPLTALDAGPLRPSLVRREQQVGRRARCTIRGQSINRRTRSNSTISSRRCRSVTWPKSCRDRGHFWPAAELLAGVLRLEGAEPAEWCDVALLLVDGGRPGDALSVVNSVLFAQPELRLALATKSHTLANLGSRAHQREALQLAEGLSPREGDEPVVMTALAGALVANGRVDEAETLLDLSGDFGTEAARAARLRLLIAELRGDDASALRWAAEMADLQPFNASNHIHAATPGSFGAFSRLHSVRRDASNRLELPSTRLDPGRPNVAGSSATAGSSIRAGTAVARRVQGRAEHRTGRPCVRGRERPHVPGGWISGDRSFVQNAQPRSGHRGLGSFRGATRAADVSSRQHGPSGSARASPVATLSRRCRSDSLPPQARVALRGHGGSDRPPTPCWSRQRPATVIR